MQGIKGVRNLLLALAGEVYGTGVDPRPGEWPGGRPKVVLTGGLLECAHVGVILPRGHRGPEPDR